MQSQQIAKTLKKLEARRLIQQVKSIGSKNKKVYMLVGLEPARELTGGSWYSGGEFDHELIRVLAQSALAYIQRKEKATAAEVHAFINESGLVRGKQLRLEDIDSVLRTLVYDARAEMVHDPRPAPSMSTAWSRACRASRSSPKRSRSCPTPRCASASRARAGGATSRVRC